jgi:hypothetical protein
MRTWRQKGIAPDDPTSPPGNLAEFTDAYSRIKIELMDVVTRAIIKYLDDHGMPHDSELTDEALKEASEAFEMATGGMREKVIGGELTEV